MHLTGEATQWMIPGIYYHLRSVRSELLVSRLTGWVSVLSTQCTIDNAERTSTSATTLPVIAVSALADDAEIRVDITQVGDGTAKGLKVTLNRTCKSKLE